MNGAEPRTLTDEDIASLRLSWRNRHGPKEIRALLRRYPGRSVWVPETREFGLVAPWRHRDEIAAIEELAVVRHVDVIVRGLIERSREAGAALLLVVEHDEVRRPAFYERLGFAPLEDVITYELTSADAHPMPSPLTFMPATAEDPATLAELLRLDHSAFPWLWWNSAEEFRAYEATAGVELFLGLHQGQVVSYIGITTYRGWAHLDRIAVAPAYQGGGFGFAALAFATETLRLRGARRIGLSTQRGNLRSQRLYERFGFCRSSGNDYRLYGVVLDSAAVGHANVAPGA